jgi:uncharacterized membrane protein YfcA
MVATLGENAMAPTADLATFVLLAAVFLGAIVQGFSGFAFSAVAGAILLQFQPSATAIPLLMLCSLIIQAFVLVRLRKSISWSGSLPYIAGGAAGVLVATAAFDAIEPCVLRIGFGCFLVLYASWTLLRPRAVAAPRRRGLLSCTAVGFAGGMVGGFTAMPGTVLAMWCDTRAMSKMEQRGVVQPFIATMQVLALACMFLSVDIGRHATLGGELLIALPALLLGALVGLHLFKKVDEAAFRKVVCALLLVSGSALALG